MNQDNARDIAEAIDHLIIGRQAQQILRDKNAAAAPIRSLDESCELIKRRITDYLLATDPRPGVYRETKEQTLDPWIGPAKERDPLVDALTESETNERLRKKHGV
jgi:hypothetical protein